MPRKMLPSRKAKAALDNLRLESARRAAMVERRKHHAREAALALRRATPDWVDMDAQIKQLQLEAEMDAMEAIIDERRPKVPILNFDLMPGFKSPEIKSPTLEPTEPLAPHEIAYTNIKRSGPPNEKDWKHPGYGDNRHPADDWRNYE